MGSHVVPYWDLVDIVSLVLHNLWASRPSTYWVLVRPRVKRLLLAAIVWGYICPCLI